MTRTSNHTTGEPVTYDLFGYRTRRDETSIEDTLARIAKETGTPATPEQWQQALALADQIAEVLGRHLDQRTTDPEGQHIELVTRKYGIDIQPDEVTVSLQYWATPEGVNWAQINTVLDLLRTDGYTILNAQNGEEVPPGYSLFEHYAHNYEIVLPRLIELSNEAGTRDPAGTNGASSRWWRRLIRRP